MINPVIFNSLTIMIRIGRTKDIMTKVHGYIRYFLLSTFIVLPVSTNVRSQESRTSIPWHIKGAAIRFRIEKDDDYSLIPNVSLLDIEPDKKSANVKKWIEKNRWNERRRINGRLHQNLLPSFGSSPMIYNLHKDFTHFVARAGFIDGADPNASVSFELYADKRLFFRTGPLTMQRPLVEINAAIPARTKQLKLVTKAPDNKYYRWAKWIDPGFMLRGQYPNVSLVRIYAPGYNLEDFVPEILATSSGDRVNSRILFVQQGEPMDILFESPKASPSYLVYLVPKDRYRQSSSPWQGQAGLVLETKWTKRGFQPSDRLPQFIEAFNSIDEPVGRSLVDNIHHSFPIHRMPEYNKNNSSMESGFGLYYYQGFFQVNKNGKYIFATISRWDSYLIIDDKLVVSWPGKHDIPGGIRGEKQGSVSLQPGIHKLEYYHYSPWGRMYSVAAWKKPNEKLRVMTRGDFVPVGRYKATSSGFNDPNKVHAGFEWSTIDDFRLEQTGPSFVAMRFKAVKPAGSKYSYRWTFDDGTIATGDTIDHVFLRPALRKVQLRVSLEDKLLAQAVHDVYVHGLWDKCLTDSSNIDFFDKIIQERNLDKAPADDLINLFTMAEEADRPDWKKLATAVLGDSLARLVQESDNTEFIFDFGQYLYSTELRNYDKALELFGLIQKKSSFAKSVHQKAMIYQAEVLTKYFGKNQETLKILNQLQIQKLTNNDLIRRATTTKALAMLALGQTEAAIELIQQLNASSQSANKVNQEIKHSGLMRHARLLAENQDDPNQLDYAMANIETIITEDPLKVISPTINLIKLDIYLARKEFQVAFYLTERLEELQLNGYDRAQILSHQVMATCGMKDMEKAKSIYAQLSNDYPYSPAVAEAKKAIIQTFGQ